MHNLRKTHENNFIEFEKEIKKIYYAENFDFAKLEEFEKKFNEIVGTNQPKDKKLLYYLEQEESLIKSKIEIYKKSLNENEKNNLKIAINDNIQDATRECDDDIFYDNKNIKKLIEFSKKMKFDKDDTIPNRIPSLQNKHIGNIISTLETDKNFAILNYNKLKEIIEWYINKKDEFELDKIYKEKLENHLIKFEKENKDILEKIKAQNKKIKNIPNEPILPKIQYIKQKEKEINKLYGDISRDKNKILDGFAEYERIIKQNNKDIQEYKNIYKNMIWYIDNYEKICGEKKEDEEINKKYKYKYSEESKNYKEKIDRLRKIYKDDEIKNIYKEQINNEIKKLEIQNQKPQEKINELKKQRLDENFVNKIDKIKEQINDKIEQLKIYYFITIDLQQNSYEDYEMKLVEETKSTLDKLKENLSNIILTSDDNKYEIEIEKTDELLNMSIYSNEEETNKLLMNKKEKSKILPKLPKLDRNEIEIESESESESESENDSNSDEDIK